MMMIANHNNNYTTTTQSNTPFNYQHQQQYQQQALDVSGADSESPASSPQSTQSSLLSQYYSANANYADSSILGSSQVPDLMPSTEQWLLSGQQQTPRGALRLGHHRESSLSSLGSNGPASPYNVTNSNPQIAVTDSNSDTFHDMSGGDANYSYNTSKPLNMNDNFYATLQQYNNGGANGVNNMEMAFPDGLPNMSTLHQRPRSDRNLLPAPELSASSASRSHPVSVASSIAGGDSPATPSYQEPEEDLRRRKVNGLQNVPKLDRTMTDIYSDELYNPNFTITSASPPSQTHMAISPTNDLFAQRLQAANSQHLTAGHSPISITSRHQSPFRNGSPLAPTLNDFSQRAPQARYNTAQQMRERQKAEQDAKVLQQHIAKAVGQQQAQQQQPQQGTPNTISPKDALLDFNEADDASNFPLFPAQESNAFSHNAMSKALQAQQQQQQQQSTPQLFQPTSATPLQNAFNFSMPTNIQMPNQYPFVARHSQPQQQGTPATSTFSRMSSAETSVSDGSVTSAQRPARVTADGGTYTCTYHGCTQRFETPALLQKHKREGHRQANALSAVRAPSTPIDGGADSLFNTQNGPHRCDRINPSTGKPCATIFSRPYDLTRHEDTIHNARKQKVRCDLCTEEKTFSRADALTRHYRVCHPDVEFPGKHRRRGGQTI